jgi:integrase
VGRYGRPPLEPGQFGRITVEQTRPHSCRTCREKVRAEGITRIPPALDVAELAAAKAAVTAAAREAGRQCATARHWPWEARCRYRDAAGHMHRPKRTGETRGKAEAALKAALTAWVVEDTAGHITRDTLMRDVGDLWLAEFEDKVGRGVRSRGTLRDYKGYLKNHVVPAVGELRCHEVKPITIDKLLKKIRKRPSRKRGREGKESVDLAVSVRAVLTGICSYAVRHGAMETNPVDYADELNRAPEDTNEVEALDDQQVTDLLAGLETFCRGKTVDKRGRSLGPRARPWLDLPDLMRAELSTAARIGELLALSGADVVSDEYGVVLWVRHHVIYDDTGKLLRVQLLKGGKPARILRVPEWSAAMWRDRAEKAGPEGPLFPSSVGTWLDPSGTFGRLRDALDGAGFGWVSSHMMRKTVARILDEAGLTLTEIADQLGNTVAIVEKHYRPKRAVNSKAAAALSAHLVLAQAAAVVDAVDLDQLDLTGGGE